MRPEAEAKLRQGFARRVDEQASRYAAQLADAERFAMMHECGEVVGVFAGRTGGGVRPRAYVIGLLPLAAIPLLIAVGAISLPGMVPLLVLSPFLIGGWFGLSIWRGREPRRHAWMYAFTDGFVLSDHPRASAFPVRWSPEDQAVIDRVRAAYDSYQHASAGSQHRLLVTDRFVDLMALAGRPEEVREQVCGIMGVGGVGRIILLPQVPGQAFVEREDVLRLFAEQVMARL